MQVFCAGVTGEEKTNKTWKVALPVPSISTTSNICFKTHLFNQCLEIIILIIIVWIVRWLQSGHIGIVSIWNLVECIILCVTIKTEFMFCYNSTFVPFFNLHKCMQILCISSLFNISCEMQFYELAQTVRFIVAHVTLVTLLLYFQLGCGAFVKCNFQTIPQTKGCH